MGFFKKAVICGIVAITVYYVAIPRDVLVAVNINSFYDYIVVGAGSAELFLPPVCLKTKIPLIWLWRQAARTRIYCLAFPCHIDSYKIQVLIGYITRNHRHTVHFLLW